MFMTFCILLFLIFLRGIPSILNVNTSIRLTTINSWLEIRFLLVSTIRGLPLMFLLTAADYPFLWGSGQRAVHVSRPRCFRVWLGTECRAEITIWSLLNELILTRCRIFNTYAKFIFVLNMYSRLYITGRDLPVPRSYSCARAIWLFYFGNPEK